MATVIQVHSAFVEDGDFGPEVWVQAWDGEFHIYRHCADMGRALACADAVNSLSNPVCVAGLIQEGGE
jgi:hypothetical protein